ASLDLAWTASGRLDAYWEHNLNSWDIAAGILMVREAGGFVSDLQGKNKMLETGDVLVGNEYAHRLILRLLKQAETAA
ncbi:MAG: inositol monophosphatase family protein, partial [Pseudomonadota bacterium]